MKDNMKKAAAALFIAVTLCGCEENAEAKEYRTVLQTTEFSESEQTDTLPENEPVLLETLNIPERFFADLSFLGKIDSEGKYHGTLSLTTYNFEDTKRKTPVDTLNIYENETFELNKYNDEPIFMWIQGTDFFTFSRIDPDFGSAVRLFDINILGKISPYAFEGDYEIFGENIGFMPRLYNDKYRFYDRGSRTYTEYSADPQSKTIKCEGTLNYRSDIDSSYLVMRSDCLYKTFSGDMTYCMFGDYLTETDRDSYSVYYRVAADFARTREELEDIFAAAFTDEFIRAYCSADIFESSGEDLPPIFSEDNEGLIYAEYYTGVPVLCDYDTVRLITDNTDPDTLAAAVFGTAGEEHNIIIFYFDKTQEGYPLKGRSWFTTGTYFSDE